jgi:hypothetical protein
LYDVSARSFGGGGLHRVATQRLTVATLAEQAAVAVAARFERWRSVPDAEAVDWLCMAIREHSLSLSIVYFAEWVDRWLMGDLVPGPGTVAGRRFEATCLSPVQAIAWADRCGSQYAEQGWLAGRLREAAAGWGGVAEPYAVLVIREAVGPSPTDDEVRAAAGRLPAWLADSTPEAEPGAAADRRADLVFFAHPLMTGLGRSRPGRGAGAFGEGSAE